MTDRYPDKGDRIESVKRCADQDFYALHPTDEGKAFREIETWAGTRAAQVEGRNEREGVPEHPQDVKRAAVDGALDGGR